MSHLRIPSLRTLSIATFLTIAALVDNHAVLAKDPPSDACAMLPAAQLAKELEQPFGSPAKTTAPSAFPGSPTGTDCTYQSGTGAPSKVLFRIYVESSPAVAKETFDKLSAYFGPNRNVTGNWNTAYLDAHHAIHVLKGKVRYYLNLNPLGSDPAKTEKQLTTLATSVAGQL